MGIDDRNRTGASGVRREALPAELEAALDQAPAARAIFEALPESHRREYLRWIQEANRDVTRERRSAQTVMRLLDSAG